jgi:malate dehydrogenase (oxaloacetate-decarboxylating)(NADP+)
MPVRREDALAYHSGGRPGKIQVVASKPFRDQRDLSLAYTPGVAEPCREIAQNPENAFAYTARANLVAVVTNGTAILGLGNLGPLAAKPVMEGKAVLFKTFADIDVFDLEVGSEDPEDLIRFCQLLEPSVGGINLEDIRAPDCFYIEDKLRQLLQIPVFHDDQHGTAIISGAALINALELQGKEISRVRVVFVGAGAAGIATAEHYVRLGVRRENIVMFDQKGLIHRGRVDLDRYRARFAVAESELNLERALEDADVFVGLSVGGVLTPQMLKRMAPRPIIFALANPIPEIMPEEARAARPDAIVATGRSDYPNQVNNVLGFPFIFRGALDVRARAINEEMKLAATRALADLAREDVPESVTRAYGLERLRFGPDYIIPKPFDPRVLLWVAPAVAWAAVASNVAGITVDVMEYRASLEARLGRARAVMRALSTRAASDPRRIVFPEGPERRILRAARILVDEGIAHPILLGEIDEIRALAQAEGVELEGIELIDPARSPFLEEYARAYWERRQRKGVTLREARERVRRPIYFGCMMVAQGHADALVAGEEMYYPDTIRPALETVGVAGREHALCSIYMMIFPNETYFFADCTVNIDPDAERLAAITLAAASFVKRLGIEPQIALLSFSNFGSARHPESEKVAEAVRLLHERYPDLAVDGEMQADTAVVESLLKSRYPFARLRGPANVLIFPDLNAANICYKLLARLGGAQAIGPILVGMAKPVHVLQRDSDVSDIVNIAVIAAIDAQERARRAAGTA